ALLEHPDVAEAAVVGEPDPRTGEAIVAFVVPEPDTRPGPDALLAHCARSLARYKCPTRVEIVDALPRSFAGKVLRRQLRPGAQPAPRQDLENNGTSGGYPRRTPRGRPGGR